MSYCVKLLLGICIVFLLCRCAKDDWGPDESKLPSATEKGKDVFGCKINGEIWRPEQTGIKLTGSPYLDFDFYQDELTISAHKDTAKSGGLNSSIAIWVESGFHGEGTYELTNNRNNNLVLNDSMKAASYRDLVNHCNYNTDSFNTGKLTITNFDTSGRDVILSGRFHFTAIVEEPKECETDTVRVTEGRFDIDT